MLLEKGEQLHCTSSQMSLSEKVFNFRHFKIFGACCLSRYQRASCLFAWSSATITSVTVEHQPRPQQEQEKQQQHRHTTTAEKIETNVNRNNDATDMTHCEKVIRKL
uniref:Uncharacterized protein n=1 Tax=Elaeophora elaphi TaxID=1147741 RepID=A0A0R3RWC0_9BILA